ncbi:MAG: hypothetical protein K0Q85_396 [Caproiciproducens sp.]|nr:hypothetical protein [Caproiciproducens sp.]
MKKRKQHVILEMMIKYVFILFGSALAAAALETFFKSHNLIGGGIIGTAVMISYLTEIPLSAAAIILNLPFLLFGYRRQDRSLVIPSIVAMISFICWVSIFRTMTVAPQEILPSTLTGGILLGVGSGLVLQYGGYLDGVEFERNYFNIGTSSVNNLFFFINLVIICISGLVFGWGKAIYSIMAYFIIFKTINSTLELFNKTKEVVITSEKGEDMAKIILERLEIDVTFINGSNRFGHKSNRLLCSVTSNYEYAVLKSMIYEVDVEASVFCRRKSVSSLI